MCLNIIHTKFEMIVGVISIWHVWQKSVVPAHRIYWVWGIHSDGHPHLISMITCNEKNKAQQLLQKFQILLFCIDITLLG